MGDCHQKNQEAQSGNFITFCHKCGASLVDVVREREHTKQLEDALDRIPNFIKEYSINNNNFMGYIKVRPIIKGWIYNKSNKIKTRFMQDVIYLYGKVIARRKSDSSSEYHLSSDYTKEHLSRSLESLVKQFKESKSKSLNPTYHYGDSVMDDKIFAIDNLIIN